MKSGVNVQYLNPHHRPKRPFIIWCFQLTQPTQAGFLKSVFKATSLKTKCCSDHKPETRFLPNISGMFALERKDKNLGVALLDMILCPGPPPDCCYHSKSQYQRDLRLFQREPKSGWPALSRLSHTVSIFTFHWYSPAFIHDLLSCNWQDGTARYHPSHVGMIW